MYLSISVLLSDKDCVVESHLKSLLCIILQEIIKTGTIPPTRKVRILKARQVNNMDC